MAPSSLFLKAGAVVMAALTTSVAAVQVPYEKHDVYKGETFFDQWDFFTGVDPTHGFVDFKGRAEAQSKGLIDINAQGQAYMGVDYTTKYTQINARGRASVRVESKKKYDGGLFIADIAHMPGSICGVWPAFWTVGLNDWPQDGEIDILENISEATVNVEALHTGDDCVITSDAQGGSLRTAHCSNDWTDGYSQWPTQGCSTTHTDALNSYGDGFNKQGGAIYAMEWNNATIKIWMFGRNSVDGLDALSANPNPSNWGKPTFSTAASTCDIPALFKNHTMIFDTTFCGDYAGLDIFWQQTSCYKNNPQKYPTCAQYVASQPSAYEEAFWLVNYVHVYQRSPKPVSSTSSSTVASSTTTSTSSTSSVAVSSTSSAAVSSTSSTAVSSTSSVAVSSTSSVAVSSTSSVAVSSTSSVAVSSTSSVAVSSTSSTAVSSSSSAAVSSTSSTAVSSSSSAAVSSTSSVAVSSTSSVAVSSTSSAAVSSTSSTAVSSSSSAAVSSTSSTAVSSTSSSTTEMSSTTSSNDPSSTSTVESSSSSTEIASSSNAPSSTVESSSNTFTKLTTDIFSSTTSAPITTGPFTTPILSSTSGPYSNSSISVPTYPTLTSTIISTSVYTITSCAPTVTSCTKGQVITATITSYTTYCPRPTPTSSPVPTSKPAQLTTSTVYTTSIITITKCPVTVTSCPAHSTVVVTSTYALYTTVCPVDSLPTKPAGPGPKFPFSSSIPAAPVIPVPTTPVVVVVTKPVIPVPTTPVVVVVTKPVIPVPASHTAPYGGNGTVPAGPTGTGKPVTTIKIITTPVVPTSSNKPIFTGAAVKLGTSISALVGVAAMALLL